MSAIKPTIYLIKESIKNPRDIFKKGKHLTLKESDDTFLYYIKSKKTIPDWAHFVDENFATTTTPFNNSSSYAVLVLKIEERFLAIPFGMGIHLMEMTKTDYNFGLKTAINCIPKAQIRQIDTTTPEINSQKTKKQAVVGSTPEEFGINMQKDILRGIVGKLPVDHELGETLEGKDSLRLGKSVESLLKLKTLCQDVLKHYQSDTYKKDYPWIDNIALMRDKSLINQLTILLAKNLKQAKFDNMFFAPPLFYEFIFDCKGFIFSSGDGARLKNKDSFEMPSMSDWKNSIGESRKAIRTHNRHNDGADRTYWTDQ